MHAETIELDHDYTVEILYDEDASNPMKEFDGQSILALHAKAKRHFGWSNSPEWSERLQAALDAIAERGHTRELYGERGALAVVERWLRAFYGIRVVLPVSAGEHSGTWVYLGDGAHWSDPGGWDSGWVGWLFATPEQISEWGFDDRSDDELTESLTTAFVEFADWVSGAVYGYNVMSPDGEVVDSCFGFYGDEWLNRTGYMWEQITAASEAHWDAAHSARTALYRGLLAAGGGDR